MLLIVPFHIEAEDERGFNRLYHVLANELRC